MNKDNQVTIQAAYPLSGTLTIPNATNTTFPAVLFISGSGKANRDGNIKQMNMNLYKDLAKFLTSIGFATLRYDKRGTHQSGGNFLETGLNDLIDDAVECVKFLQIHPRIDKEKVLLLDHSEGSLIAPAEPSIDLLPKQNEMAYTEMNQTKGIKSWLFKTLKVSEKARKQNKKISKKIADSDKAVMRVQGIKLNAKWLRETFSYNVCDYLKEVTCPVLAITGGKDLQVPPEHVKLIAEMVKGESEWHIIPDMNHILRKYDGQHTMLGLLKEYKKQLDQPIDSELLDKMGTWLQKYY